MAQRVGKHLASYEPQRGFRPSVRHGAGEQINEVLQCDVSSGDSLGRLRSGRRRSRGERSQPDSSGFDAERKDDGGFVTDVGDNALDACLRSQERG